MNETGCRISLIDKWNIKGIVELWDYLFTVKFSGILRLVLNSCKMIFMKPMCRNLQWSFSSSKFISFDLVSIITVAQAQIIQPPFVTRCRNILSSFSLIKLVDLRSFECNWFKIESNSTVLLGYLRSLHRINLNVQNASVENHPSTERHTSYTNHQAPTFN